MNQKSCANKIGVQYNATFIWILSLKLFFYLMNLKMEYLMLFSPFYLQQEKIQALQSFADLLINGEHYDSDAIQDKRDQVLDRWSKLKEALIDNRSKLGEAQTLQQFSRDADEMENWLQEKLQIAMDESYKDPTNIQVSYLRTF